MRTVAVIGGNQECTFKKIGKKYGVQVVFHTGKSRNGGTKKEFRDVVKKADICVILLGAIGHVSMDIVKELCKQQGETLLFHKGFGATGAIETCVNHLNKSKQAA